MWLRLQALPLFLPLLLLMLRLLWLLRLRLALLLLRLILWMPRMPCTGSRGRTTGAGLPGRKTSCVRPPIRLSPPVLAVLAVLSRVCAACGTLNSPCWP